MKIAFALPILLLVGFGLGLFVRPSVDVLLGTAPSETAEEEHASEEHDHAADGDHEEEEDHVALSQEAFNNLKLKVQPVALSDYVRTLRMPGEVVEAPGLSGQEVVAPVTGILTKMYVSPGVSISAGAPLFELRILDQQLLDTQLKLLELLTQREVAQTELDRIAPLTANGSVPGRRKIELQYEIKKIDANLKIAEQALTLKGLKPEQLDRIRSTRELITTLRIQAPVDITALTYLRKPRRDPRDAGFQLVSLTDSEATDLTVEAIHVEPGQTIPQGGAICSLAMHGTLMVSGHAFENEINKVAELSGKQGVVSVEFGSEQQNSVRDDLTIQYVANHIDEASQSFHFYVPLPNEVLRESRDSFDRLFRAWKYKVGQRVHVVLPTETIADRIVLPRGAVVQEGPNAFVFRQHVEDEVDGDHGGLDSHADHDHEMDEHDEEDEHHEEMFIEFEPVPVEVVSRDQRRIVVKPGGELAVGENIAMNGAYQLLLAMKAQASGGGGHDHHHH